MSCTTWLSKTSHTQAVSESERIHFEFHKRVKLCVCECDGETFDYKSVIVKQAGPKKINAIHAQVTTVPLPHWQP